jgi:hypothetical protein
MKPETIVSPSEAAANLAAKKKKEEDAAAAKEIKKKRSEKLVVSAAAAKAAYESAKRTLDVSNEAKRVAELASKDSPSAEAKANVRAAKTAQSEALRNFNIAYRAYNNPR